MSAFTESARQAAEARDLPRCRSGLRHTSAILAVDDDVGTRDVVQWALSLAGMDVTTADSGAEGLAAARMTRFDLMLVDQRLPDMLGTDFIRTLRHERLACPFVLISGFLTTAITVEAMKLGAVDVIEKPVDIDTLVPVVCEALSDRAARGERSQVSGERLQDEDEFQRDTTRDNLRPGSAAERWALHVLHACESTRDLKTIEDWAAFIGVSYSSLRESCHVLGISPHDARDLMRVLRAVIKSRRHRCSPEVLLDVSDGRTLQKLLRRAGFRGETGDNITPHRLLRDQQFVSRENAGLRILMLLLLQHSRV
jgi:two-component system, LuxR family, response regulator FixJ